MLQQIRKSRFTKFLSAFIALTMMVEMFSPMAAYALTGGPSQPEVQSFEPIGTSEMVDVFSGDFVYNIPLMDIDGYPINISYHSGITMDQEASWVGLGWNINAGAITRNMRGIPDDFKGDVVKKEFNMKANRTIGISASLGVELFGKEIGKDDGRGNLSYGLGLNWNSYNGVGFDQSVNATMNSAKDGQGPFTFGLGINSSSSDGLSISPSVSFDRKVKSKRNSETKIGGNLGLSLNSRAGLKALTIGTTARNEKTNDKGNKTYIGGSNGGSPITFGSPTYVPNVDMPRVNNSISFSFKTGTTIFGTDGTWDFGGHYTTQHLQKTSEDVSAYGYLNTDVGFRNTSAMLDFNREKDGSFTPNTPGLPLANHTFDVYSVAGQGIGGMYRPFRSEVGSLRDRFTSSTGGGGSLGIELGGGNLFKIGADIAVNTLTDHSGPWTENNPAANGLQFIGDYTGSKLYEPVYFKEAGEKSVDPEGNESDNNNLFGQMGSFDPVRVKLDKSWGGLIVKTKSNKLEKEDATEVDYSTNHRTKRVPRNQAITFLTVGEAKTYGLQPSLYNNLTNAPNHHIGEITNLKPDGTRYVFGLPAYNLTQQDVTFNAAGRNPNCGTGLVTYLTGDNSVSNKNGLDNYFSKTTTPAYAHSYFLTAVLSSDYVDHDLVPGPSKGDLGTYTKFNYEKLTLNDIPTTYKWRVPVGNNQANYNEGLKTDTQDDQGNYIYGEKEIWYLKSIETKNYVAVFTLESRKDGLGVSNNNGQINPDVRMRSLKKISLYSKPDFDAFGTNAFPIKEVHFVYDYSLCRGVPNNLDIVNGGTPLSLPTEEGGKLTLKKIFFTYGRSDKARFSPYKFTYKSGTAGNPNYNLKGYDRWGNFKPNEATSCDVSSAIAAYEFPYVDQDKSTADERASAWSMDKVELPSGGIINVDYEADDYAYVQNRKAMQMFKVTGIGNTPSSDDPEMMNNLMSAHSGTSGDNINQYIYFKLDPSVTTTTKEQIFEKYINGLQDKMYFRFLMDITKSGDYEYVSGYCKIKDWGYITNTSYPGYGFVQIDPVNIGDRNNSATVHPISKASWQFARLHNPRLAWGEPDPTGSTVAQLGEAVLKSFTNFADIFKGPNKTLRNKDFGKVAYKGKSWIRLQNPSGFKYGGGVRVKKLTISDNWNAMSGGDESKYGQVYSYTTTDDVTKEPISSGVASYEPIIGGDENPFRQPVTYDINKMLIPDDELYQEEPYGESFFPDASVGYSRVEVRSLKPSDVGQSGTITRHATGKVVHEFYTAKDFPVITKRTGLDPVRRRINPIINFLGIEATDHFTGSQGYVIELNDMHGKPKAQWVYAEDQPSAISGVEYYYKTDPANSSRLSNLVDVILKDGSVKQKLVGVDYDMVNDIRENQSNSVHVALNGNLAGFIAGIFPGLVPTIWPDVMRQETRFRSTVITKVINRFGILDKTVAHDLGSRVETANLAFDAKTGEVLVTKTKNDFEDQIFNFTYPAHWSYNGMGQAYQNIATSFGSATNLISFTSGVSDNIPGAANVFVPGDELALSGGAVNKGWVLEVNNDNTLNTAVIKVVDKDGVVISGPYSKIKIIRSGHRNQHITPVGTVTLRKNPLRDNNDPDDKFDHINLEEVINTSAAEFSDRWQMFAGEAAPTGLNCEPLDGNVDLLQEFFEEIGGYFSCIRAIRGNPGNLATAYAEEESLSPCEENCTDVGDLNLSAGPYYSPCSSISLNINQVTCEENCDAFVTSKAVANAEGIQEFFCSTEANTNTSVSCPQNFSQGDASAITMQDDAEASACVSVKTGSSAQAMIFAAAWCALKQKNPCIPLKKAKAVCEVSGSGDNQHIRIRYDVEFCDGTTCYFELNYDGPESIDFENFNGFTNFRIDPEKAVAGLNYNFIATAHFGSQTIDFKGSSCIPISECVSQPLAQCGKIPGNIINPYQEGIRGIWRPLRSHAYLAERKQTRRAGNDNTDIRVDGTIDNFQPFWNPPLPNSGNDWSKNNSAWTFTSEVTKHNPFSPEVENKDALGRFSGAVYGYNHTLPILVASNANYNQVAFDGFEDYSFIDATKCEKQHFNFFENRAKLSTTTSHTGKYSMRLANGETATATRALTTAPCSTAPDDVPYTMKECDNAGLFSPHTYLAKAEERKFVLTYWVKEKVNTPPVFDYTNSDIQVKVGGSTLTPASIKKGDIIEGWQRVEKIYDIALNATGNIDVILTNNGATEAFFDDIRLHPFNSNMKSFVYHPVNLRYVAQLDENNYATIYEYDEEGILIRVKKETERGIMTIKETRNKSSKLSQ